jgi:phospholipid/cholesterol/gamma-HCH transport system substrate-binding protein
MKQRQTGRVVAGIAIIIGTGLLLLIVTSMTVILQAIRGTYDVHAVFEQASGLRVGAPVWIAGHDAGQVTAIGFRPVGHDSAPGVVVTIRLPKAARTYVRRDSRVRLTSARLVGDPIVDITPGSTTAPLLQPGDTLYAPPPTTHASVMRQAVIFSEAIDSLMAAIESLKTPVERASRRWEHIGSRLDAASSELAILRNAIAAGHALDLRTIIDRIHALGNALDELQEAFARAGTNSGNSGVKSALENARRRASHIARELDEAGRMLEGGMPGRMQTDSAITVALRRAQVELDSLVAETRRNPLRFWFGNPDRDPGY